MSRPHLVAFNFSLLSLDVEPRQDSLCGILPFPYPFFFSPELVLSYLQGICYRVSSTDRWSCHYSRTANHTSKARKHLKRPITAICATFRPRLPGTGYSVVIPLQLIRRCRLKKIGERDTGNVKIILSRSTGPHKRGATLLPVAKTQPLIRGKVSDKAAARQSYSWYRPPSPTPSCPTQKPQKPAAGAS